MLMLITYDISFDDPNGQARLRRIAKHCLDYGVRAQYSVFECDVTPDQWVILKNKLLETYDPCSRSRILGNVTAKSENSENPSFPILSEF